MDQVGQTAGWLGPGAGRPARVWGGSAWALVATRLHEEKPESVEKVDGGCSTRPVGHHLVPNWPLQVGGGPIHPYKYPPHGESQNATQIL
jgi:hypothetical protein